MKPQIAAISCVLILAATGLAIAEPIASIVAVRGKATIERKGKKLDARPKLGIELQDTVTTAAGSRAKLLFIDDSVLTLAEQSRMSVDTFVHSRSDRGKSLFNLIDGKMRAVVGKTRFEVKTPTVVAAARGTVILFDVGMLNGQPFTRITCLEGIVDIRSLTAPAGSRPLQLSPGQSILVVTKPSLPEQQKPEQQNRKADEAPAQQELPAPVQLTPAEIEQLKRDTSTSGAEIRLPDSAPQATVIGNIEVKSIPVAPNDRQQPPKKQPTKVNIGVKF